MSAIVLNISRGFMLMVRRTEAVGGYKFPQNCKLKGVIKIAATVANAVRLTLSAVFPPERWVIKLEIFPPGQAATKIIPNAILGFGCKIRISPKVKAGRIINCEATPSKDDLGLRHNLLKSDGLMSSATPNITIARHRLSSHNASWLKCICIESISKPPCFWWFQS